MKISSFIYLIIPILLGSCSHHYYIPNVQNVPLFREKNEFRISAASGGSGGDDSSTEVQAAYAISNCIGIMANYMSVKNQYTTTNTVENGKVALQNFTKENFIEGAVGYFKPLNKSQVFEVYGGFGGGPQSHQYAYNPSGGMSRTGTSNLSHYRLFMQPSWGYKTQGFELAFSTRLSDLFYNNFRFTNLYYDSDIQDSGYDLGAFVNKSHFLIEPAVTTRVGWKNVKFQFQYSYSSPINSSDKKYIVKNHFSLGLYFSFANNHTTK